MQNRDYLELKKFRGGRKEKNEQILRESMQNENKLLVNQQDNQYSKIFMFFLTRYSKTFMYVMNA